ncbi:MAG: hypothetical protein KJT03_20330, partial [Verrucomicrobiae bacterium]|nr:hypothetical protein [Verrucomicrobiae bacterium]
MFFDRARLFTKSPRFRSLLLMALLGFSSPTATIPLLGQNNDAVAPLILRGDSVDSVLALLEKLTGRSVLRPQGLPAPLFNFTSQKPLTVSERIIAIESLLALNGIAVVEQGDLFLKVVPSSSITGRTPEFIEGNLNMAPTTEGIFTRFFSLSHLTT